MTAARQIILAAVLVCLAAVLQGRGAHALRVGQAQPDFVLIALGCSATLLGGARGIALGFWSGLLTASLNPGTFGTYLASRTLAGAFAGWLQGSVIRDSVVVPPLALLATTLVAEVISVLMAPTHHLRLWALQVGGETLYNMLLALPVYFLLRRLGVGRQREDPFALHS